MARKLIGDADDGGLGDGGVLNKGRLDLGRGQAVTADVDNIVNAAADPVEALVVSAGTVSRELRLLT